MAKPNFPAELGSINYDKLIGAPLDAAVRANAEAAQTSADFITTVAFKDDGSGNSVPIMVTFQINKEVTDAGNTTTKTFEIQIPFLLLVNVPYVELDTANVQFNVKLQSTQKFERSSQFEVKSTVKGKHGWGVGHVKWKVSASYQRSTKRQKNVKRTYHQNVDVTFVSVDSPRGVDRILDMMEQAIKQKDTSS